MTMTARPIRATIAITIIKRMRIEGWMTDAEDNEEEDVPSLHPKKMVKCLPQVSVKNEEAKLIIYTFHSFIYSNSRLQLFLHHPGIVHSNIL